MRQEQISPTGNQESGKIIDFRLLDPAPAPGYHGSAQVFLPDKTDAADATGRASCDWSDVGTETKYLAWVCVCRIEWACSPDISGE
jgi:hypothetical protein